MQLIQSYTGISMKNLLCTLIIILTGSLFSVESEAKVAEFNTNFSHTVFFWLKNPDSAADRAAFEAALKKFLNQSAYAKTQFIGKPPKASRDVVDGSFTYSLVVSFESAQAQQGYQDELSHKVFVEEASALWTKVIVYDSVSI